MRSIFIADAHLQRPEDDNYRQLLSFLASLRGTTDTLYILGDLFEHWIGYRRIPSPAYAPVVEELKALRANGTSLVMFEGNHDFHLEPFFSEQVGATIFRDPATLTLEGKTVYLCHGDQINTAEHGYRLLRYVLHSRMLKMMTATAPIALTDGIATRMSRRSKKNHRRTKARWDFRAILSAFAAERFHAGCDVVIAGHFHTPFMERSKDGRQILVSLGDWVTQFSYGEWKDGELTLREYR